ncbi:MotA/TolQ/ExbB proton channel family protein [Elusimicrobiota bacterium]
MIEINYLEVLRTSYTLIILIVCSVILMTFTIERWWFFGKIKINVDTFLANMKGLLDQREYKKALEVCEKTNSPVAAIAKVAILNHQRTKNEVNELVNAARLDERLRLEAHLGILGTLGNTAPFIGLFGTVVGIIKAFHDLALSGSGGPTVVAAGIAEALVATAGGIGVAIPAVVFFNYFLNKSKSISIAMETTQMRILVYLKLT